MLAWRPGRNGGGGGAFDGRVRKGSIPPRSIYLETSKGFPEGPPLNMPGSVRPPNFPENIEQPAGGLGAMRLKADAVLEEYVAELHAGGSSPAAAVVAYDVKTGTVVKMTNGPVPQDVNAKLLQVAMGVGGRSAKTASGTPLAACRVSCCKRTDELRLAH